MKRFLAVFTLILVLLMSVGCGGDKIAGKWVGISKRSGMGQHDYAVVVYDIQKNGKNYIVNSKAYYLPSYFISDYKKGKENIDKWDIRDIFKGAGASINDNIVDVQINNSHITMTYIEKDNTMQVPQMPGFKDIKLEHDKDGKKLKQLKDEVVNKRKELVEKNNDGTIYKVVDDEESK